MYEKKIKAKIISGNNTTEYLRLRRLGYTTLWAGEGKIAMAKNKKNKYSNLEYKEVYFNKTGKSWGKMSKKEKFEFANKVSGEHY